MATRRKICYVRTTRRTDAYIVARHDAAMDRRRVPLDELCEGDVVVWTVGAYEIEWLDASVVYLLRRIAGLWEAVCAIRKSHAGVLVDETFVEISQSSSGNFVHGGEGTAIDRSVRREFHDPVTATKSPLA